MAYQALTYAVAGRIATLTLNRPERMNAISLGMPGDIAAAVDRANRNDAVHAIVLTGAGDGFCSGYDLKEFAEAAGEQPGSQLGGAAGETGPWDPMADFYGMYEFTQQFMSLWRSYKPTIARVHGPAVAGGSDIALCCDLVDGRDAPRGDTVLGVQHAQRRAGQPVVRELRHPRGGHRATVPRPGARGAHGWDRARGPGGRRTAGPAHARRAGARESASTSRSCRSPARRPPRPT